MKPIFLAALSALAIAAFPPPDGAQAEGFQRSGSVTGPGGRSATRDSTVTRDGNTVSRSGTVQGSEGRGWSFSGNATRSGDGTLTRQNTVTTNSGRVIARDATRTCDRSNGGIDCSGSATTTGPNGNTASSTSTRRFRDGQGIATFTRTGPGGRTVTGERWITVTP